MGRGRTFKVRRLALRILQNRTGLVPRPSWCTYRVRPPEDGTSAAMMDPCAVRLVFGKLGELDLVRLCGPEPLSRPDLLEVAEAVLDASRPSILHLTTEGRSPDAAAAFCERFSAPRHLRVLVAMAPASAEFTQQRRHVLALETLERLRAIAHDRAFGVAASVELDALSGPGELDRLRAQVAELGAPLFAAVPRLPPGGPAPARAGELLERIDAALEGSHEAEHLARRGERYVLAGAKARLQEGSAPGPRPRCTSLRSHVRVEADGRVPTCGFLGEPVGDLRTEAFDEVWFGGAAEAARGVVDACPGCWSAEEVLPSALYGGELGRMEAELEAPAADVGRPISSSSSGGGPRS